MSTKVEQADTRVIAEPSYYHREYKNDFPKENASDESWLNTAQRVAITALPFLSLYKPLSFPLSLATGGLRTFTSVTQLLEAIRGGNAKDIAFAMIQTAVSAAALAGTIFAHPLGMLISTAHDLVTETIHLVENLKNGEYEKAISNCLNIINNALYLALFLHGGLELTIASLALQILVGLYHSQAEFRKGHFIEGFGQIGMSLIRGHQLAGHVNTLQMKWKIEDLLKTALSGAKKAALSVGVSPIAGDIKQTSEKKVEGMLVAQAQADNPESPSDVAKRIASYSSNLSNGWTALHQAVKNNDTEAVKFLLESGMSPNVRSGITAREDKWEEMFGQRYKVTRYSTIDGYTPIELAIENGNAIMTSLLLDYGADPHQFRTMPPKQETSFFPDYESAVYVAIQKKNYEVLRVLADHKIDFSKACWAHCVHMHHNGSNKQIGDEKSCFDVGFESGDSTIASILLNHKGVNTEILDTIKKWHEQSKPQHGWTVLHHAAKNNDINTVRILLESGYKDNHLIEGMKKWHLNYDLHSRERLTALDIAVDNDNGSMAALLLDYGANPHGFRSNRDLKGGWGTIVFDAIQKKRYNVLRAFVSHKVNFKKPCLHKVYTPSLSGYDVAFASGDPEIISMFLNCKND